MPCKVAFRSILRSGNTYWGLRVIDLVNESAEPQTVAQQDELVLVLCALPAHARQELDRLGPLSVRELCLPRERVEVGYKCGDELKRTGVLAEAFVELLDAVSYHVRGRVRAVSIMLRRKEMVMGRTGL